MRARLVYLVLWCGCILSAAGCDLFADDTVVVRGTVTDAATGEPVAGVSVSLEAGGAFGSTPDVLDTSVTDADGRYTVETTTEDCTGFLQGFYVAVYHEAYGYTTAGADCDPGEQIVDLELTLNDPRVLTP